MASILDKKVIKDDRKFLIGIISVFIIVAWLCSPFGNKYTHMSYMANNIMYQLSKMTNSVRVPEYIHMRNNAVFMANLHPKQSNLSLNEMNKAISSVPDYVPSSELAKLYKDRAYIKLYYGDKRGALEDYLLSGDSLDINDRFKVANLLLEKKQYKMATEHCKYILENNYQAFIGYACLANVYESAGRTDVALRLYGLAVSKKPGSARAYIERAQLKLRMGDMKGYTEDLNKAKQMSPNIDKEPSLTEEALSPKKCTLTVI